MRIVEKMFPGVNKEIEQIDDTRYRVTIKSHPITIEGEITIDATEMRYDIKRIKNGNEEYIVSKQFYRRASTDSITRLGDIIIVTNLSVETPTRTTKHSTNYRVNLEYLFSVPVRSLVTPSRSIYSDISFYRATKYPAYITLETKTEKYNSSIIEDIEKAVLMYSITPHKINLEYYDIVKPVEIETNAQPPADGIIQRILKRMKTLIFP